MSNATIIRLLNVVAVIAGTVGGASTVPDLNLPKPVLAYGLFIALVAKAVAAELVQVKGQSDEDQQISPAQQAVQAQADAAIAAHASVPPPTTPPPASPKA
jgi:hypothetical protein